MKLLPAITALPKVPLAQMHAPSGSYERFRSCLRWEFGFSCSLCFLHEADLIDGGVEGTGLMSIEHFVPKSIEEGLRNQYSNCILACRFCNRSRGRLPNVDPTTGAQLLNPTAHVWASAFTYSDDGCLVCADTQINVTYTHRVYDLSARRKSVLRKKREKAFSLYRQAEAGVKVAQELLAHAKTLTAEDAKATCLKAATALLEAYDNAHEEVYPRYWAIPADAPIECGCLSCKGELPSWLLEQTTEM